MEFSASALTEAIRKALAVYAGDGLMQHYRSNGMSADFSWERTGEQFMRIYELAARHQQ